MLALIPVLASAQAGPRTDTPRKGELRITFEPVMTMWDREFTGSSSHERPLAATLPFTTLFVRAEQRVTPLAFDFGFIYYWYPRERQVFQTAPFVSGVGTATFVNTGLAQTVRDSDYWEVYGKVTWDVIKDKFALGANFYYSPDWLGSGAFGFYASGTAKLTMQSFNFPTLVGPKEVGWYISGEVGHYSLGTADKFVGVPAFDLPDYWTWNVGVAFTHGVFTLDLRYYDTDLTKQECFVATSDLRGMVGGTNPVGQSKWCGSAFVVATKFDLTVLTNVK